MKRILCILISVIVFLGFSSGVASYKPEEPATEVIAQVPEAEFPQEGIPVLMYHSISTVQGNIFCVPEEQFRREMAWLSSQGYNTITMDELCDAIRYNTPLKEKPILITFDDGYKDNYDLAFPIMRQYGFTATFFLVTDFIGPGWLTWDNLKELSNAGNCIESHTASHVNLKTLSYEEQRTQLLKSKKLIEENVGTTVRALCYPFGQYDEDTLKLLQSSGYELAFTTKHGRVYEGDRGFELKRIGVDGGMPLSTFIKRLTP